MKELKDVYFLPGMLTHAEIDCLYHLGQCNRCEGTIVEIGIWKGKSTIALALGAAKVHQEKICAIDPHKILPEEKYFEDTEVEFFANIKQAGIDSQVAPMIMTSEEAARGGNKPVRLLWIDGAARVGRYSRQETTIEWLTAVINCGDKTKFHSTKWYNVLRIRGPVVLVDSIF